MTNEEMIAHISEMLEAQTTKMTLLIENTIAKRLDSLFDGYMLTREKQIRLENRVDSLEDRVDRLEGQAG
jgi:polyhydroxyalkanoate synthesis regulator phasin